MKLIFHRILSRSLLYVAGIAIVGFLIACAQKKQEGESQEPAMNTLSAEEEAEGWMLLFDGQSMEHWTGLGRDHIPAEHWVIEEGTIKKVPSGEVPVAADGQPLEGGDIMTKETFENFEFTWEWKISPGGNSGIKYNVSEEMSTANEPVHAALGFEYQILDDERHPDGEDPTHRAGGLYDLIPPNDKKQLKPVAEWNQSRLIYDGMHIEHWLNGEKVVETDIDSEQFQQLWEASKYSSIPAFPEKRDGHIVLQDHKDAVWYRNLKIRRLAE